MEDDNFNENGFSLITDFQENSEQDLRYTTINEECATWCFSRAQFFRLRLEENLH